VITVNGYANSTYDTNNSNFAVLVSVDPSAPFKHPGEYCKGLAQITNYLAGDKSVIVQRLNDFVVGRATTDERLEEVSFEPSIQGYPGNLNLVLPYRVYDSIKEFLIKLDRVIPGLLSDDTILYGIEIKTYSQRVKVDDKLRTDIENFYLIGDGSGLTRGLVQASMSGLLVADNVVESIKGSLF